MSTDLFELHIQQSLQKLEDLGRRNNAISALDSKIWQSPNELPQQQQQLLTESLEELSASIEELQLATETLKQQNEELLTNRHQLEIERQYYRELFNSAPDCYLLTTEDGTITEVNQKTTELLGLSAKYLQKKTLAVFIAVSQRQEYYTKLNQLKSGKIIEATWQLEVNPRNRNSLTVECLVTAVKNSLGATIGLRWRISPLLNERVRDNSPNSVNLTEVLIDRLRYPLYDLATQIEEVQSREQLKQPQRESLLKEIGNCILDLKQVVNNAYILDRLKSPTDLNPSLVDYTVFMRRLIRQVQQRKKQHTLVFNCQNTHVGIIDVFLLSTIIRNLLDNACKSAPANSQIEVALKLNSSQYLVIEIKNQIIKPSDNDNLNLIASQKSIELLTGEIQIKQQDCICITKVKLPVK